MSKPAFTPGPWRVYRTATGFVMGIGDDSGDGITDGRFALWRGHDDEAEANARLIAAAPDMYEALKLAYRNFEGFGGTDGHDKANEALPIIRAAIAKATGDKP